MIAFTTFPSGCWASLLQSAHQSWCWQLIQGWPWRFLGRLQQELQAYFSGDPQSRPAWLKTFNFLILLSLRNITEDGYNEFDPVPLASATISRPFSAVKPAPCAIGSARVGISDGQVCIGDEVSTAGKMHLQRRTVLDGLPWLRCPFGAINGSEDAMDIDLLPGCDLGISKKHTSVAPAILVKVAVALKGIPASAVIAAIDSSAASTSPGCQQAMQARAWHSVPSRTRSRRRCSLPGADNPQGSTVGQRVTELAGCRVPVHRVAPTVANVFCVRATRRSGSESLPRRVSLPTASSAMSFHPQQRRMGRLRRTRIVRGLHQCHLRCERGHISLFQ